MRVCWMKWTSGLTGDGEDDRIKSRVEFAWCKRVSDMSVRLKWINSTSQCKDPELQISTCLGMSKANG